MDYDHRLQGSVWQMLGPEGVYHIMPFGSMCLYHDGSWSLRAAHSSL